MKLTAECFWAFQTRATFWAIFEKFLLVSPLHFFRKCWFWVTLQKIAITWRSGHFWSCCLRQNQFQSLHVNRVLIRGQCHLRQTTYGFFKRGLLFGQFLKNFSWSPLCPFSENARLGDLAKIAITWPFGYFWSRLMRQNLFQSLHVKSILIEG